MNNQEKSSLSQAASTAQTIHRAIKTGKAISAAAKGAAVGGPYGAAAGAAPYAAQHGKKFLAAAAVLLMLPVLFVLMLPSLIFGGLTSSGSAGQRGCGGDKEGDLVHLHSPLQWRELFCRYSV